MTFLWFLSVGSVMLVLTQSVFWQVLVPFGMGILVVLYIMIGLCLIAIGLYGLREYSRLYYGLIELLFGFFLITLSSLNAWIVAASETWVALLLVAASVYILVRAMDNIGEGLKLLSNQKWSMLWQRIFPKAKSKQ